MNSQSPAPFWRVLLMVVIVLPVIAGYFAFRWWNRGGGKRTAQVWAWFQNPWTDPAVAVRSQERCGNAPFQMPTEGLIGFLWDDSFRPGHRHQGIDIFAGQPAGQTPVYTAYPGYLSRLPEWRSAVIIRIPEDPLEPGRQIWTFYTHMADRSGNSFISEAFPPGTSEVFVEAGTLLGYQGDYSGNPSNPTGVHLHFSIVKDDGEGSFLNELDIRNTLDPSPYFGLQLNGQMNKDTIPVCGA